MGNLEKRTLKKMRLSLYLILALMNKERSRPEVSLSLHGESQVQRIAHHWHLTSIC